VTTYEISANDDETAKAVTQRVKEMHFDEMARRAFADSIATAIPVDIFDTPPYEKPTWLVDHYMPEGELFTLTGEEGVGKGLLSVYWAVQVLNLGKNVLWMSTEDDANEVKGRLGWAGWETTSGRLFHVDERMILRSLRAYIQERDITLVIMDAGRDFMTPVGSHNDDVAVRSSMRELMRIAKDTNTAIEFIHHTNKATHDQGTGKALSSRRRSGGAGAFRQVARHNLELARNDQDELGVGVVKSNIHATGHITEGVLAIVEPYGRAFEVDKVLNDEFQFDDWRTTPTEAEIPMSPAEVDDLVTAELRKYDKPPGVRPLYDSRALPMLSRRELDGAYTRLQRDGVLEKVGRGYVFNPTRPLP
jgi:hypothetical protein